MSAPRVVGEVHVDSAFLDFFAEYRDLLPTERVLCLYGTVENGKARLQYVRPAKLFERTATYVRFADCPHTDLFIGHWHNHSAPGLGDMCWFSIPDSVSFYHDYHAVIELVSCKGKLMARSKGR